MEENNVMENAVNEVADNAVQNATEEAIKSGMSSALKNGLIGFGIFSAGVGAGIGAIKLGKKLKDWWANRKAKKAQEELEQLFDQDPDKVFETQQVGAIK